MSKGRRRSTSPRVRSWRRAPFSSTGGSSPALPAASPQRTHASAARKLDCHALGGSNGVPTFGTGLTRDLDLHAHGAVSLNLAGFVVAVGTVDLRRGTLTASDFTGVDLFALTVSGASLFAGVGGTL